MGGRVIDTRPPITSNPSSGSLPVSSNLISPGDRIFTVHLVHSTVLFIY
jgi:hypothetical protein